MGRKSLANDADSSAAAAADLPAVDAAAEQRRRDLLLAIGALNAAAVVEACAIHIGQVCHTLQWSAGSDVSFDLAVRSRNLGEELHAALMRSFGPESLAPPETPRHAGAPKVWTPGGGA